MATYTDNGTNTPNGSHKVFTYTFPVLQTEDIKVALNGIVQATTKYTASLSPAQIEFNNTSIDSSVQESTGAPKTGVQVRVFRETTVGKNSGDEDPKAVFAAGSSIRAADLNANTEQALFAIHELQTQPVKTSDIEDGAITSAKIKDLTIVDADISATAEIEVYKLKDGAANQVLVTQNDGTTVNWSSNIDLSGTLDVAGNVDFDGNLDVDGTTNLDSTNIVGDLYTVGTAIVDNVFIDGNTVETLGGDLNLKAYQNNNVVVDDNLAVTGTLNVTQGVTLQNASATVNGSQIVTETASQTLTNKTLTTPVINDMSGTAVVTSGTSTSDNKVYSAKRAGEIFYGKGTVEEIQSGETWAAADDKVATTAAIDARIIDLVDDVGGFVPIANETSFPDENPDINNASNKKGGTIVSIKSVGSSRTPSNGTVSIANGNVSNNQTITINGCGSTVLAAGFGVLVETTQTDHTYNFHRLVPKATEVTTVASKATEITTVHTNINSVNTVATNISNINAVAADATDIGAVAAKATEIGRLGTADAVADMAILGTADVVSDLNTLGTADVVADMNMLATSDVIADMNMLAVSDVISDMNDLATSGNITAMSNCSNSIANINTAATNLASINSFANTYRIGADNPTTSLDVGDLFFNTTSDSLKVYTGSAWVDGVTATGNFAVVTGNTFTGSNNHNDNVKSIYGAGNDLQIYHDGSDSYLNDSGTGHLNIVSSQVNILNSAANEAIAKFIQDGTAELYYDNSKKFETTSNGIDVTGDITINGTSPTLNFTDSNNDPDFKVYNNNGNLKIHDVSNSADRLIVHNSGNVEIPANLTVGGTVAPSTIDMEDNEKIRLGTGNDLQLWHDGSNSYIKDNGTGELRFISNTYKFYNAAFSETLLQAFENGKVELFYDNSKKLETTSSGISVAGNAIATGNIQVNDNGHVYVGNSGDLDIYHDGTDSHIKNTNNSGELKIRAHQTDIKNADNNETQAIFHENGKVELFYDNSKKLETISDGVNVEGITYSNGLIMDDNHIIKLGIGRDLQIYHDGSTSYVSNTTDTGLLIRNLGNGDIKIKPQNSYPVELYYNGSKKLETSSQGVNLEGNGSDHYILDLHNTGSGKGSQIQFRNDHDASATIGITGDTTGDLRIYTEKTFKVQHGADVGIKSINNGAVELYYDNSKKFETTSTGATITGSLLTTGNLNPSGYIKVLDGSDGIYVGTGNDLQIYHDGSNSYVSDTGTGSLILVSNAFKVKNAANNEAMIYANENGAVELYYDNSKKLETYAPGTKFYGQIQLSDSGETVEFKGSGSNAMKVGMTSGADDPTGSDAHLQFHHWNGSSWVKMFYIHRDRTNFVDGKTVAWGNSSDLEIYHSGGDNYINILYDQELRLTHGSDYMARFIAEGSSNLYYDNSNKLWTTSSGVTIQGDVIPYANSQYDLGSTGYRWANLYVNDMHFANSPENVNCVDGTWGDWTLQEGEETIYMINNRNGKKYKMALQEVS